MSHFSLPPLDRRGVVLGLAVGPVATLVAGVAAALLALSALPGTAGGLTALVVLATAGLLAWWPVAGQPLVAWIPTAVGWVCRGRSARLDATPLAGTLGRRPPAEELPWGSPPVPVAPRGQGRKTPGSESANAPAGLRLLRAPAIPGEGPVGMVEDRRTGCFAAVLPVVGRPLGLLPPAEQASRLAGWGAVLAGLARSGGTVRRVQWVATCTPSDVRALSDAALAATGPAEAVAGYRALVDAEGRTAVEHRTHLVVSARPRTTRRGAIGPLAARGVRSRHDAPAAAAEAVRREVRLVRAQLRNGEVVAGEPLTPAALARVLGAGWDPTAAVIPAAAGPAATNGAFHDGDDDHDKTPAPWPLAVQEHWGSLRVDGTWQVTYWVAEWPRLTVGPDFLAPLLLGGVGRTVAVTMAPVAPERAVRDVQSARTSALADEALRARAGFLTSVRREREAAGVQRREAELADGHADYRYSGYVTVSGRDSAGLEAACADVEQAARQAHLVLRRLYGRQAEARTWTLPLGRGLS